MIVQLMIAVTGATAVFLTQCASWELRRWACVIGLIGQPFWFIAAYTAEQWGVFFAAFLYTIAWARGLHTYWLSKEARATRLAGEPQ